MAHIYEDSPDGKTLEIGNWKQHRPPLTTARSTGEHNDDVR